MLMTTQTNSPEEGVQRRMRGVAGEAEFSIPQMEV